MTRFDMFLLIVATCLLALVLLRSLRSEAKVNDSKNRQGLGISRLVREVRSELEALDRERMAQGADALFLVDEFELELNFVATKSAKTQAGAEFEVVTVGAEQQFGQEEIQKLTLKFKPAPDLEGEIEAESPDK